MALVILTFMAVITYGTWVASSVAEEKSSRVMELLITAATPRQLLGGKVLGTGAAGLTPVPGGGGRLDPGLRRPARRWRDRLYGSGGDQIEGIDLAVLLPFGVFFLAGFMLYATLYAALGSMASRQEEVQQVTGPMIFLGMIGYFAAFIGLNTPDAPWIGRCRWSRSSARTCCRRARSCPAWRPGSGRWPPSRWRSSWSRALSIASRIYAAGVLLYGQRPSLRSMFRAVRVDR